MLWYFGQNYTPPTVYKDYKITVTTKAHHGARDAMAAGPENIFASDDSYASDGMESLNGGESDDSSVYDSDTSQHHRTRVAAEQQMQKWLAEEISKGNKILRCKSTTWEALELKCANIERTNPDGSMLLTLCAIGVATSEFTSVLVTDFRFTWNWENLEKNMCIQRGWWPALSPKDITDVFNANELDAQRRQAVKDNRDLDDEHKARCESVKAFTREQWTCRPLMRDAGARELDMIIVQAAVYTPGVGPPRLKCEYIVRALNSDGSLYRQYACSVDVDMTHGTVFEDTFKFIAMPDEGTREAATQTSQVRTAAVKHARMLTGGASAAGNVAVQERKADGKRASSPVTLKSEKKARAGARALPTAPTGGMGASVPAAAQRGKKAAKSKRSARKTWHTRTDNGWVAKYVINPDFPRICIEREMLRDNMSLHGMHAFLHSEDGCQFRQNYRITAFPSLEELEIWFLRLNAKEAFIVEYEDTEWQLPACLNQLPLYCTFCTHLERCDCHKPADATASRKTLRENARKWCESPDFAEARLPANVRARISEFAHA